jgi:hypothetical protein
MEIEIRVALLHVPRFPTKNVNVTVPEAEQY